MSLTCCLTSGCSNIVIGVVRCHECQKKSETGFDLLTFFSAGDLDAHSQFTKEMDFLNRVEEEVVVTPGVDTTSRVMCRFGRIEGTESGGGGCSRVAVYGMASRISKVQVKTMCPIHKSLDMVYMGYNVCSDPSCSRAGHFNVADQKVGLWCLHHKKPEMKLAINRECEDPECKMIPSYGYREHNHNRFCALHKEDGTYNLRIPQCKRALCPKTAVFGLKGARIPIACSEHKTKEMLYLHSERCLMTKCQNLALFNHPNMGPPVFCTDHHEPGMVEILQTTIEEIKEPKSSKLKLSSLKRHQPGHSTDRFLANYAYGIKRHRIR